MISLVSLISKGMWNNKDEIADTFFLRHCSKRSLQGCHIFHEKTRAGRKFQPKWTHELFTTEIPWKPFLTCQDDDEMVTHVASARSDAKSKKKKKAIDRFCFVSNGRGDFFFGVQSASEFKAWLWGWGIQVGGALFLVGFLSWMLQRSPFLSKNPTRAMNDGDVG